MLLLSSSVATSSPLVGDIATGKFARLHDGDILLLSGLCIIDEPVNVFGGCTRLFATGRNAEVPLRSIENERNDVIATTFMVELDGCFIFSCVGYLSRVPPETFLPGALQIVMSRRDLCMQPQDIDCVTLFSSICFTPGRSMVGSCVGF